MADAVKKKLDGTRKIIPTDKSVITSGEGKKGKWTLYEIKATNEAGEPLDIKLKTFANMKLGEVVEVEVEQEDHEQFGRSFMLSPKGKGSGLGGSVDELRERVETLEAKMTWAANAIEALQGGTPAPAPPANSGSQSGSTPRDPATPASSRHSSDDDIPF